MTQHEKTPGAEERTQKSSRKGVVILVIVAVLLALCVAGMILGAVRRHRNETAMQVVVVRGDGDVEITNRDFNYYYWSEYLYFVGAAGENLPGFDASLPAGKQPYDDTRTWEDYFIERTLITIRDTQAMVLAAGEEGFTLTGEYESAYERALSNFREAAQAQGYRDVDAYLRASYGADATEASFAAYLHDTHLSAAYADALYERISPTEQEAEDYLALHEADYVDALPEQALSQAAEDLRAERYRNDVLSRTEAYAFEVSREAITLFTPKGL